MAKQPDVWLRHKGKGKARRADSWYFRKTRLFTKDEEEARARAKLARAGKWPPPEQRAAHAMADAFRSAPTAPEPPPPPPPVPQLQPVPEEAGPPFGAQVDWGGAAAAAGAETFDSEGAGEAEPEAPPQISNEQLAQLVVSLQTKMIEIYTRKKVFKGFVAPGLHPELVGELVGNYKTVFDYAGTAVQLPPWVNGLVVPGVGIAVTTSAMVEAFRDAAEQQKKAAEEKGEGS